MSGPAGIDANDVAIRQAAFKFLDEAQDRYGEVVPYKVLIEGFQFRGRRIPLIGPQGIFKPAAMELPLSIATAPPKPGKPKPYDDEVREDGLLAYRYRGTDPAHRDNVGLRACMTQQAPLVYLHGIVPGEYLPFYPVFITADQPNELAFLVDVTATRSVGATPEALAERSPLERRYAATITRRRMHQEAFKVRVLRAYRTHCAVCRLRHRELLEAAHIVPDSEGGLAHESNGLALCKLHHAAFDSNILGIRPDLVIEIREDVLREHDGPMLSHGLQEFDGRQLLVVPSQRALKPARDFLDYRYERFRRTGT